ncbi:MAG: flagellar motor protein MotB [Ruminiclostridium sp.]|nr:flagellar motor protein MotB [Ruminiclostridium sp.]
MALKKRGGGGGGDDSGNWLTTYGDLMTNLLCFFILLFSMATIDSQKYEELANSLRSSFQGQGNGSELRGNMGKSILTVNFVNPDDTGKKQVDNQKYVETVDDIILDDTESIKKEKMQRAMDQMKSGIIDLGLSELIEVIDEREYLLVRLNDQVLFKAGSAEIMEDGRNTLDILGKSLISLENEIMVVGHTDTVPINTPLFPSNWELSTKRATNVVLYMVNSIGIKPGQITAAGNGEFKPIGDNRTVEGRQKNRRIELMILKN